MLITNAVVDEARTAFERVWEQRYPHTPLRLTAQRTLVEYRNHNEAAIVFNITIPDWIVFDLRYCITESFMPHIASFECLARCQLRKEGLLPHWCAPVAELDYCTCGIRPPGRGY